MSNQGKSPPPLRVQTRLDWSMDARSGPSWADENIGIKPSTYPKNANSYGWRPGPALEDGICNLLTTYHAQYQCLCSRDLLNAIHCPAWRRVLDRIPGQRHVFCLFEARASITTRNHFSSYRSSIRITGRPLFPP